VTNDWVVVGAGVLGLSVACDLALRGTRVTVVEARYPNAGTSGTTFGWVNANDKLPESYFRLKDAGVQAHHAFAADDAPLTDFRPQLFQANSDPVPPAQARLPSEQ
jgi:glycine/D-amino acid oxidase-like deaminating enzyme